MRRILVMLIVAAFLSTPAMAKCLKPFQPPSPKKMTKTPIFPNKPLTSLLKLGQ